MPRISIKKGVSEVSLYDGERSSVKSVLVLLSGLRPHLQKDTAEHGRKAEESLLAILAAIPEPEKKPRKKKAAAA